MSSTPALSEPADLARQRDEDAQYYREVLHKFIAMATDLAAAVHRQALAEPAATPQSQPEDQPAAPSPSPSQATSFDRLARTVRRTIALARKLSEPAREAPGPRSHPTECPKHRRPHCAATNTRDAEPWAEPCERPEGPDCDDDEDLDEDYDEQEFADLIASLRDSPLAHLTDAELDQLCTPPSAQETAQGSVPSQTCCVCPCAARLPRASTRSGSPGLGSTGPPEP